MMMMRGQEITTDMTERCLNDHNRLCNNNFIAP